LKALVLGCGLMGSAVAVDLARSRSVSNVVVMDTNSENLKRVSGFSKIKPIVGDVQNVESKMELAREFDVVVGALPSAITDNAVETVVKSGVSMVDLIFERVDRSEIDSVAKKRGVTIVPACGFAPGISNMLTMHAVDSLSKADEVRIKVGGLPQQPRPPLNYRVTFSIEDLIEEYLCPARVIQNGKLTSVEALTGLETVSFPPPLGECEAFYTDGLSTLISTIRDVNYMDEKTVRYPGHAKEIRTLIECGLLDQNLVGFHGTQVSPKEFVTKVLAPRLRLGEDKDVTVLRIDVNGTRDGHEVVQRFEMIDYYDEVEGITSMARTTAFTASIAAQMVGNREVEETGIVPPELAFRGERFTKLMKELASRGIKIRSQTNN